MVCDTGVPLHPPSRLVLLLLFLLLINHFQHLLETWTWREMGDTKQICTNPIGDPN